MTTLREWLTTNGFHLTPEVQDFVAAELDAPGEIVDDGDTEQFIGVGFTLENTSAGTRLVESHI